MPDFRSHLGIESCERLPAPDWLKSHLLGDAYEFASELPPDELRERISECKRETRNGHVFNGTIRTNTLRLMPGSSNSALTSVDRSAICHMTGEQGGTNVICRDALPVWSLATLAISFAALIAIPLVVLFVRLILNGFDVLETAVLFGVPLISSVGFRKQLGSLARGDSQSAMPALMKCLGSFQAMRAD